MSKIQSRFRFGRALACLSLVLVVFAACEDDTGPGPLPSSIVIVSGDGQYSKQGTELQDPIVVGVTLQDGARGVDVPVRFSVRSGGGTLSQTSTTTNGDGEASVRWTLGPTLGTQEIEIEIADNSGIETVAQATAAIFHCPEEDPAFVRRFLAENDLFLFTRKSGLIAGGGPERVGIVQIMPDTPNLEFAAISFVGFDENILRAVVRDCAFSANGEFYIAWTSTSSVREIAKVNPNHTVTHFATLEGILGTEITSMEGGVLAGCDEFGPFTVGCRDTLTRYADAIFDGTATLANNKAVACDTIGNYLYFIDQTARRLRRVPLDGYTQTGPTEEAANLTTDEAVGANGMVVHDQTVYLLVESANTKSIVSITSTGTKQTEFDFFSRGAGDAAGVQSDLALLEAGALNALYTLDTLNNVILIYVLGTGQFEVFNPDNSTDPGAASEAGSSGELVGLAVLP